MTENIDISNLIGPGSTIFGKKKKSKGNPNGVKSSQAVPMAALRTPPSTHYQQKSRDLPSVPTGGVDGACRRRSSNIVARDTRMAMSSLSPTAVLTTPPPPKFKPPRWTPNSLSSYGTQRRSPPDGTTRHTQDTDGEQAESEETENADTSTPHLREEHEDLLRRGTP